MAQARDRNAKFLHKMANIQRRYNIDKIKKTKETGVTEEQHEIKSCILEFYTNLHKEVEIRRPSRGHSIQQIIA